MPYDDDKFGRIWPTRQGNTIGGARERQMLDAIGGADSFRTSYSYNPDGSITELRTKDGMPQFTTTKKTKIAVAITTLSRFYAVPSSQSYLYGYTPSSYPGPVSIWSDWRGNTVPPGPYSGTGANLLVPSKTLTDSPLANENVPGGITWYSDSVVAEGEHVIISWRGPSGRTCRSGYYGNAATVDLHEDVITDGNDHIWLGPDISFSVGVTVTGAGIRYSSGVYTLVVMSFVDGVGIQQYEGVFSPTTTVNGKVTLNKSLHGTSVTMSLIRTVTFFSTYSLSQPVLLNASATKAITIVKQIVPDALHTGAIIEIDLATGSTTDIYGDTITTLTIAPSISSNVENQISASDWVLNKASSGFISQPTETKWGVAADYVGDVATYLYIRRITGSGSPSYSSFVGSRSGSTYTYRENRDERNTNGSLVELIHSSKGVVFSTTIGTPSGTVTSVSRDIVGVSTSQTISETNHVISYTHTCSGYVSLINADLRKDGWTIATDVTLDYYDYDALTTISGNLYYGAASSSSATATSTQARYTRWYCSVLGKVAFDQTDYVYNNTTVTPYGPTTTTVTSAQVGLEMPPSTFTGATATGSVTPFWPTYIVEPSLLPLSCHLVAASSGEVAYADYNYVLPTTSTEVGKAAFVSSTSGASAVTMSSYVPGSYGTLANPIFYPPYSPLE